MTSKKTSKIFSDHLVKIFVWNEEKKKSSYESIKISYSIRYILTKLKLNINDENIFIYFGHEKFPFKLKPCDLDIPIVKIFFDEGIDTTYKNNKGINTTYKNDEEFWIHQPFTKYSIHIFNYDYLNTMNLTSNKLSLCDATSNTKLNISL